MSDPGTEYDGSYYAKGFDVFKRPQLKSSGNVSLGSIVCTAMVAENAAVIATVLNAHDDMLAALKQIVHDIEHGEPRDVGFDMARAAIAKAEQP